MPLNGGGTASKPPGTTAVPNTTIASAPFNSVIDDIYAIFNTPRPIAYGGTNGTDIASAQTNLNLVGYNAQTLTDAQKQQARTNIGAINASSGDLYGLTLSNNATDATNDIDIAAGSAASDGATPFLMKLASGITKRLDASWAVGTGNGGLDTGSIANTTYHMYLIQRSDTGVVDACFSASAVAPTTGGSIPVAYDRYRRIGSILRESATIIPFIQVGDTFLRTNPGLDVNATNPGTSAVLTAVRSPLGINAEAILNVVLQINSGSPISSLYVSSPLQSNDTPSLTAAPLATLITSAQASNNFSAGQIRIITDTTSRIRYRVSASDATTFVRIAILGWVDTRGRT